MPDPFRHDSNSYCGFTGVPGCAARAPINWVARAALSMARPAINSATTSARVLATGLSGSALGLPCTTVLASPALGGVLAVVAAPLIPAASWRILSLSETGASAAGELLGFMFGTPWVWLLASPALGGTSELPPAEVL